ncbi:MAG: M20/M25/M40 family metallo-hydrolase [Burkholderiales bacterium]|nr:M20/M25/M40 family metallo-hydrolase [Burkholderiales bacterium]
MNAALGLAFGAALVALLLWVMVSVPGESWRGALPPLREDEAALAERLKKHVATLAAGERNTRAPARLEAAARHIEAELQGAGYRVRAQPYDSGDGLVRNLEAVREGRIARSLVVGAHYDSVFGSPGANDNGSGVAALVELARGLAAAQPRHTLRFAFFANEEPPYFATAAMGSRVYADELIERGERIAAMFSLETIGYYAERPGSQRYPFPLGFFYPDRGDFVAFVANLGSRSLLHAALAAFRREARFPAEGVAAPAFIPGVAWSDQRSFWRRGVPAVMITDTALYRYPHYHLPSDTPDKLDYERLARLVAGLERMLRVLDAEL